MIWKTSLAARVAFAGSLICASGAIGATRYNANSPLGMNLAPVNYWSTEQPFNDIFKMAFGFDTISSATQKSTGEEGRLDLDQDGWPKSLGAFSNKGGQTFNELRVILRPQLAPPASGTANSVRFVVRYEGQGTMDYGDAAKKVTSLSSPGRDVLDVARNQYGGAFALIIKDTDPRHVGNYIRNIQVVRADQEQALLAGQIFNPRFLYLLRDFSTLRFMDWLRTNGSTQSKWADRPRMNNPVWSTSAGVPYEVIMQLSNTLSADAWLNIPAMADDDYISQLAQLVHSSVGPTQRVYVELSNETWNGSFEQSRWVSAQGRAMFPAISSYLQNRTWYGMRTAQMCDIWASVWGKDHSRVVCVLATQASFLATAVDALNCSAWSAGAPCSKHNIGAVAIAPYFGYSVPHEYATDADGGLSRLFDLLDSPDNAQPPRDGSIRQALDWVSAYSKALRTYGLPLIAYEGGQSLVSFPHGVNPDNSNSQLTNLFFAVNRSPRMEIAYKNYLEGWRNRGGQLFVHFNDVGNFSQYGEFSALESLAQPTEPLSEAPPKWQAIEKFIAANPCWWDGCQSPIIEDKAQSSARQSH